MRLWKWWFLIVVTVKYEYCKKIWALIFSFHHFCAQEQELSRNRSKYFLTARNSKKLDRSHFTCSRMISQRSLNHSKIISQSPKTIAIIEPPYEEESDMVTITAHCTSTSVSISLSKQRWWRAKANQHQELKRQTGEEVFDHHWNGSIRIFQHKLKSNREF